jgi:hypothetical protein
MINLTISEKLSNGDNSEAIAKRAYLAGLIDGDGSICVSVHDRNTRKGPSRRYALTIELAMCSEPVIRWVAENFGGNIRSQRSRTNRKYWHWRLFNDTAVEVLKLVYPYLVEKKRQAALAFKFRELLKQTAWTRGSHRTSLRDELIEEMRSLNYRPPRKAVETVREAGSQTSEMIQSGLHGDVQESSATKIQ